MSKKQAIAFFEEISKNTQLAQEVEKVVGEKTSDEAKAKELERVHIKRASKIKAKVKTEK